MWACRSEHCVEYPSDMNVEHAEHHNQSKQKQQNLAVLFQVSFGRLFGGRRMEKKNLETDLYQFCLKHVEEQTKRCP